MGREPVVLIPLKDYELMIEELEMLRSKKLARDIEKSREQIRKGMIVTLGEAKHRLTLSKK
jgi:PHD/YefM family antitoxin component YafN of YafNO toxin-antitoxin module